MTRYQAIAKNPNHSVEVWWDSSLSSFGWYVEGRYPKRYVSGCSGVPQEIKTIGQLDRAIRPFGTIPPDILHTLAAESY